MFNISTFWFPPSLYHHHNMLIPGDVAKPCFHDLCETCATQLSMLQILMATRNQEMLEAVLMSPAAGPGLLRAVSLLQVSIAFSLPCHSVRLSFCLFFLQSKA